MGERRGKHDLLCTKEHAVTASDGERAQTIAKSLRLVEELHRWDGAHITDPAVKFLELGGPARSRTDLLRSATVGMRNLVEATDELALLVTEEFSTGVLPLQKYLCNFVGRGASAVGSAFHRSGVAFRTRPRPRAGRHARTAVRTAPEGPVEGDSADGRTATLPMDGDLADERTATPVSVRVETSDRPGADSNRDRRRTEIAVAETEISRRDYSKGVPGLRLPLRGRRPNARHRRVRRGPSGWEGPSARPNPGSEGPRHRRGPASRRRVDRSSRGPGVRLTERPPVTVPVQSSEPPVRL